MKIIFYAILGFIFWYWLFNFLLKPKECQDCKLKDEQYHKMIRKYNTMINNDSTHKWCIKLQ